MIDHLRPLIGTWIGTGTAVYPGRETATYDERWTIRADELNTLLQYEQITRVAGKLLSWELGFIRPQVDNTLDLINSQNNGRVEVLKGSVKTTADGLQIVLSSSVFGNDPRMLQSQRDIHLQADELHYGMWIATQSNPEIFQHLDARLTRRL